MLSGAPRVASRGGPGEGTAPRANAQRTALSDGWSRSWTSRARPAAGSAVAGPGMMWPCSTESSSPPATPRPPPASPPPPRPRAGTGSSPGTPSPSATGRCGTPGSCSPPWRRGPSGSAWGRWCSRPRAAGPGSWPARSHARPPVERAPGAPGRPRRDRGRRVRRRGRARGCPGPGAAPRRDAGHRRRALDRRAVRLRGRALPLRADDVPAPARPATAGPGVGRGGLAARAVHAPGAALGRDRGPGQGRGRDAERRARGPRGHRDAGSAPSAPRRASTARSRSWSAARRPADDPAAAAATVRGFEAAGATWWVEADWASPSVGRAPGPHRGGAAAGLTAAR